MNIIFKMANTVDETKLVADENFHEKMAQEIVEIEANGRNRDAGEILELLRQAKKDQLAVCIERKKQPRCICIVNDNIACQRCARINYLVIALENVFLDDDERIEKQF